MKTLYLVGVVLSGALAAAPAMADQGATVGGAASQFQAMHFIKGEVRQLSTDELREIEGGSIEVNTATTTSRNDGNAQSKIHVQHIPETLPVLVKSDAEVQGALQ
jgi:hypothetical protein